MIHVTLLFKDLFNTASIYLSPVAFHKGYIRPGLREAVDKGALLAGPALCFLLMLFSLPGMVHRTPPSSTSASKSSWSYSCHSSPFLNLKTIFSLFFILRINLASLQVLLLVYLPLQLFRLRPLLLDHDSHQKEFVKLPPTILCRKYCSWEIISKFSLSKIEHAKGFFLW